MASNAKHDWPMVRLGDVADFVNGYAFKPADWGEEGRPIIRIQNLTSTNKAFNYTSRRVPEKYSVSKGDILVSWSATLGVFEWDGPNALLNQHIFKVVPTNKVEPSYLKHIIPAALGEMKKHLHGATMKHVNRKEFLGTKIPLPPLDEQRRIAKILDQVDSALVRVDQFLAGLLQLKQELFTASFLEDQRESITVGEYLESTQYGTSDKANENVGIPVLRMGNVSYNGEIELSDLKYVELDIKDREKYSLKAGDLLFNRTNSKDLVGKTAVVPALPEEYTYAGYLIRCRVNDKAVPEYISGYLNSVLGKKILRNTAKAIVGMANINANELKRLPIPKASLDEQQEFASSTSRIEDVESQMKRQKKLLQELQESLSARAFQGGL